MAIEVLEEGISEYLHNFGLRKNIPRFTANPGIIREKS